MVKSRRGRTNELSEISELDKALCEKILVDLTLNPSTLKGASMCIHPFVPLDGLTLAVAPQFPLASAVDDNILRMFSYTFDALFSAQNTEKERTMIERLRPAVSRFGFEPSVELPDGTTEIDVILVDEASSTLLLAELKWSRKPNRTLECIDREKDIEKGVEQLKLIRSFSRKHPDFLQQRKKLPQSISDYANVHYLLASWDYWHWIEPDDGIAIRRLHRLVGRPEQGRRPSCNNQEVVGIRLAPRRGSRLQGKASDVINQWRQHRNDAFYSCIDEVRSKNQYRETPQCAGKCGSLITTRKLVRCRHIGLMSFERTQEEKRRATHHRLRSEFRPFFNGPPSRRE
jgi:hypothetical protein